MILNSVITSTEMSQTSRLQRRIVSVSNLCEGIQERVTERHYDKSAAMKTLIENLISHIKAFDGDIFGGVIRDYRTNGFPYIKDINCRIDNLLVIIFMNTLQLHYDVRELPSGLNGYFVEYSKRLHISSRQENSAHIIVDIVTLSRAEWIRLPCDFDINLLAENAFSCYVRSNYPTLNKVVDRYGFIHKRLKNALFALLEPCNSKSCDEVKHLIDRSVRLVTRDWIMDDSLIGKSSWLVNYWLIVSSLTTSCRTVFDKREVEVLKVQTECSLCNEVFKPRDIVINTKCNHNFHWSQERLESVTTDGTSICKGLREWMRLGNSSCPICRKNIY